MLKSNSPKVRRWLIPYPGSSFPLTARMGARVELKGRLAALGLAVRREPWPSWSCAHLLHFQHLHLGQRVVLAYVTTCARLGREPWAGFAQHWGGPTTGRPCQEAEQGALVRARLAKGTKARFRVGRCQRLPRLFSHPRQPRAHHRSGRAGAPRRREGADRAPGLAGLRLPLSWHSRRKPLGTPSAAFRPHG